MADDDEEDAFDASDSRLEWIKQHVEPAFKHVLPDRFKQRFEDESFLYVVIPSVISCLELCNALFFAADA